MDYKGRGATTAVTGFTPLVLAALLVASAACGGEVGQRADEAPETAAPPRPNVVLVLADTLRADHLGAYGSERPTSPRFDALAAESFLFEEARAQAPCTFPSANSILTGRWPHEFVGQPDGFLGIPEAIPSIAEILRDAGYDTAAISASPIVRATGGAMNPGGGFSSGFARFDEGCEWRDAQCVHFRAKRFLDQLEAPFFLYLHYLDPHDPYRPPEHWPLDFSGAGGPAGEGLPEEVRAGNPEPLVDALYELRDPERVAATVTPGALDHLRNLYDDEIRYWDAQLGRLMDELDGRSLLETSIVIVLSDHGESFYEHGELQHCRSVYDAEIRTPLLVRLPREVPGLDPGGPRRIAAQAANLDVVPTLLDYLEIPADGLELAGTSLRPAIEGAGEPRPPVIARWAGQRAVQDGRWKLIARQRDGRTRLYDLAADPGETDDRSGENPRDLARMKGLLREWITRNEAGDGTEDEAAMERLRNLGYLQ